MLTCLSDCSCRFVLGAVSVAAPFKCWSAGSNFDPVGSILVGSVRVFLFPILVLRHGS